MEMEKIKDNAAYIVQALEVLNNSTEPETDTAALVQYVLTTARDMVEELNKENKQESSTTAKDKYFKRYYLRAEMEGIRPKIENSGDVHPSASDRKITERIKTALKLIDVEVIDHVIISHNNYFSFADFGEL